MLTITVETRNGGIADRKALQEVFRGVIMKTAFPLTTWDIFAAFVDGWKECLEGGFDPCTQTAEDLRLLKKLEHLRLA